MSPLWATQSPCKALDGRGSWGARNPEGDLAGAAGPPRWRRRSEASTGSYAYVLNPGQQAQRISTVVASILYTFMAPWIFSPSRQP